MRRDGAAERKGRPVNINRTARVGGIYPCKTHQVIPAFYPNLRYIRKKIPALGGNTRTGCQKEHQKYRKKAVFHPYTNFSDKILSSPEKIKEFLP